MIPDLGATILPAGTSLGLSGGKRRAVEKLAPGATLEDGAALTAVTQVPSDAAVRVGANALAEGTPSSPVVLAPGQWIAFGNRLAPTGALVNGATVERVPPPAPWYALATDRPALLAVHGLRLASPGPAGLAPDWRPLVAGPELRELRASLLPPPPPALRLVAGTKELSCALASDRAEATLPATSGAPMAVLRLLSPVGRSRDPHDSRRFGIAVLRVELAGKPVALDGASFADGFYPIECQDEDSWRWTNGNATLALPPSDVPRPLVIRFASWHTELEPA